MPLNAKFFDAIRATMYTNGLSQQAVDGMNALVAVCEKRGLTFVDPIAYMLATVMREAGPDFNPNIREVGRGAGKAYSVVVNGQVYYGRGWPQLTWLKNYAVFEKRLNIPLTSQPDLALGLPNTATILFDGMYFGLFTGVSLQKYFVHGKVTPDDNWRQARRVVNGMDAAEEIAGHATHFRDALLSGYTANAVQPLPSPQPMSTGLPPAQTPQPVRRGLFADILALFFHTKG